jgi:hypothetical protein
MSARQHAAFRRSGVALVGAALALFQLDTTLADDRGPHGLRGALVTAEMASDARLQRLRSAGYSAAVLMLSDTDERAAADDRQAIERIGEAGLDVYYWIEVGRSPELADAHPRWMASVQGPHPEWRRFHKDFPEPKDDEIVKTYPWVPVFYREAFDAHLARIKKLLATRPAVKEVFLNDLQGAPSACGCGNPVCRWTTDYGPIVMATQLGDEAPAKFVAAVKRLAPGGTQVIPVWTTECEAHDKANERLCAGVGCYKGTCWKVYSRQLKPLAAEANTLGALLLYKEFHQDGPPYKEPAGWIGHALKHGFVEQPAKNGGPAIPTSRVIAVLQGWDVSDGEIQAQINEASGVGAAGYIVALAKIDQSWRPRMLKWR